MDNLTRKSTVRKLNRLLRLEGLATLQWNPYSAAERLTGKPISNNETHRLACELQNQKNQDLIIYSDIFGDTRRGMSIEKTYEMLQEEDFEKSNNKFVHEYLGITALVSSSNGMLVSIELCLNMAVISEGFEKRNFSGIGITEGEMIGNHFVGRVDATGGLKIKMMFLRQMASANDVEKV